MTIPKWLLPAIALVAAIAVALAAVLVGMRFAAPNHVDVAAPTVSAPILAPVNPAIALTDELDQDGNPVGSPVLGNRDIPEPGSLPPDAISPEVDAALRLLEAADDPGATPEATTGAYPADGTAGGDPCAPADGSTPPDDCPGGLSSTILASIALPTFMVSAGENNQTGCSPLVAPAPDRLQFAVITNAPASTVLTWSQDDGVEHTVPVPTSDTDNTTWQNALASAHEIGPWVWINTCVVLTDLVPYQAVHVHLESTDYVARTASKNVTMHALDRRGRPPTEIIPVGTSTVFVSAPQQPTDEVRIRAFSVPVGDVPDCDNAPETTGSLERIRPLLTQEVSAASLATGGYRPEYTQRTSTAFAVPSGAQIMVCVRWYDPGRASWDVDRPNYSSELVLVSPSVAAPVVTLEDVVLTQSVNAGSITIAGSTENGSNCGSWTGPSAAGRTADLGSSAPVVCDFSGLVGRFDADGNLVVTTRVQTPSGVAVMPNLLPVAVRPCAGDCPPTSRVFDVPLSTFVRPTALCSGDCPTNTGQSVGVARVRATWGATVAGVGDGWNIGEWHEGTYTEPRPDYPRMDVTQIVHLDAANATARSQAASFTLRTDRPASYSVALQAGACLRPGGQARVSSTTLDTSTVVRLPGLCLGSGYALTVTLTDADGNVAVYTYARSEHFWLDGAFTTTAAHVGVSAQVSIDKPGSELVYLYDLRVGLGYGSSSIALDPSLRCFDGAITPSARSDTFDLGETFQVEVYIGYRDGAEPQPEYLHPDGSLRCIPADGPQKFGHFSGTVTLEQVLAGATVTMTDPASGYTATLRLHTS